jgi:epoxyqueuosine reductase
MIRREHHNDWVGNTIQANGCSLFGVADLEPIKDRFLLSPDELKGMKYGISIGTVLSRAVLDGIQDEPTLLYKWHYRQANNLLDKTAYGLTIQIVEKGFRAIPIPASQVIDREKHKGHVSHRLVGEAAGLGWRGRNNLLVNEKYGSHIRLVTVLTDLPLALNKPVEQNCGRCHRCVNLCPAGALGDDSKEYDLDKCFDCLTRFSKLKGIGMHICGICVKACFGKQNS